MSNERDREPDVYLTMHITSGKEGIRTEAREVTVGLDDCGLVHEPVDGRTKATPETRVDSITTGISSTEPSKPLGKDSQQERTID